MADHGCANSLDPNRAARYPCWRCAIGRFRGAVIEFYALHKHFQHDEERV